MDDTATPPPPSGRRTNQLRDRLEDEIMAGRLRPGDRLDEQGLAKRFGVSRTPIREALHQLAASGLVVTQRSRGTFVAMLGVRDIVERFEVMAALEGLCGRLAARRLTADERERLADLLAACEREAAAGDPDRYYYENERFHTAIYEFSRNAYLAEQARQLRRRLQPFRRLQLRRPNRIAASVAEHAAIVHAITLGDGDGAERLLRDHVLVQGERLTDLVITLDTADNAGSISQR